MLQRVRLAAILLFVLLGTSTPARTTDRVSVTAPAPTSLPTAAPASPSASATALLAPPATGEPVAVAADPRAGEISGGLLYGWKYDGRTGTLTKDQTVLPGSRLSPSGRWRLEGRNVMSGAIIERTDLWLIDTATSVERLLYSPPPATWSGANIQPNQNIPAYPFQRTEAVVSWSPDERYLTLMRIDQVSASWDADGRPLLVIDVASGARTELGEALFGYAGAWRAPHTLAFVAGRGRETWLGKTLTVWTPESGTRAYTTPDEIGIAPAWSADGRLWFVSGPTGPYDVPTFFSGRGIGDRSIFALDIATGLRSPLPRVAGYADEGVRVSDDGRLLLLERRKLDPAPRTGQSPNSWLELWIANADGSDAKPLVKMSAVNGFGYYGGYGSLAKLEWVR
jgi:hypothetical protein